MPESFGQAQPLDRVIAEQKRMFQIKPLGVRAVEPLIQAGPSQIIGGAGIAQFKHAFGVNQRRDEVILSQVKLAQIARQALQHLHRRGSQQVLGIEFHVGPVLALQQLTTVVGVQAPTAARIEQMIGTGHAQQEVPGEVDPDQGNLQTTRQFQCNQCQRQRLPATGLQDFVY